MRTPISPALVRAALKRLAFEGATQTQEERAAFYADERRADRIALDHIRAVAAEMRERARNLSDLADCGSYNTDEGMLIHDHANELREYADQLEGIE